MKTVPKAAGALIEHLAQEQDGPKSVFIEAEALEGFRQSALDNKLRFRGRGKIEGHIGPSLAGCEFAADRR